MLSGAVQQNLVGAWRLMTGRADGLRLLDLSADGFWNSFFAILLALPMFAVSWLASASEMRLQGTVDSVASLVLRFAIVDLGAWVLPIIGLGLVARPAGIAGRYVSYVVASNWGSVIAILIMMPAILLRILAPEAMELAGLLSFALFGVTLVLSWRLTNHAIGMGAGVATAVFAGMLVTSLVVLFSLQSLLGLSSV